MSFRIHDRSSILCASWQPQCVCGFLKTQRSVTMWKGKLTADILISHRWSKVPGKVQGWVLQKEGWVGKGGLRHPRLRGQTWGWTPPPPFFLPSYFQTAFHWDLSSRRGRQCGVYGHYLGAWPLSAWPLPWIFWHLFTLKEQRIWRTVANVWMSPLLCQADETHLIRAHLIDSTVTTLRERALFDNIDFLLLLIKRIFFSCMPSAWGSDSSFNHKYERSGLWLKDGRAQVSHVSHILREHRWAPQDQQEASLYV